MEGEYFCVLIDPVVGSACFWIFREVTGFSLNKVRHKFHCCFFSVCEFTKILKFVL